MGGGALMCVGQSQAQNCLKLYALRTTQTDTQQPIYMYGYAEVVASKWQEEARQHTKK